MLRSVDVARQVGYSVQQIRQLERSGVLPPAVRTPAGYRVYTSAHVSAARAYRALSAAIGPAEARRVLTVVHGRHTETALALLDAAHASIHAERGDLRLARAAVAAVAAEPLATPRPTDSMTIAELSAALGVRASTLRHWEAERLIAPARSNLKARTYSPTDVRDARIVHQLRRAGYRIPLIRELVPQLRSPDVGRVLDAREAHLDQRSRQLLTAAVALHDLLATP